MNWDRIQRLETQIAEQRANVNALSAEIDDLRRWKAGAQRALLDARELAAMLEEEIACCPDEAFHASMPYREDEP